MADDDRVNEPQAVPAMNGARILRLLAANDLAVGSAAVGGEFTELLPEMTAQLARILLRKRPPPAPASA